MPRREARQGADGVYGRSHASSSRAAYSSAGTRTQRLDLVVVVSLLVLTLA